MNIDDTLFRCITYPFKDISFNRGSFDYIVTLDGIYIKNLTLKSDRISIVKGEGLFRFDRSIDIVCSIRTEMKIMGKIPFLGKFFKSAYNTFLRGLMTVRIQGKLEAPKVSVIPLGVGRKAKAYWGAYGVAKSGQQTLRVSCSSQRRRP